MWDGRNAPHATVPNVRRPDGTHRLGWGVGVAVVAELEGLAKAPPPLGDHARAALATLQHAFDAKHPYALHGRCLC